MANKNEMLNVIASLVDELGTEVELHDRSELPLLRGTPTIAAIENGADLLRRDGRDVPDVVGSVLAKVYPDRVLS